MGLEGGEPLVPADGHELLISAVPIFQELKA
jgi:hypothetical protein